jgi:hypothetical protein
MGGCCTTGGVGVGLLDVKLLLTSGGGGCGMGLLKLFANTEEGGGSAVGGVIFIGFGTSMKGCTGGSANRLRS